MLFDVVGHSMAAAVVDGHSHVAGVAVLGHTHAVVGRRRLRVDVVGDVGDVDGVVGNSVVGSVDFVCWGVVVVVGAGVVAVVVVVVVTVSINLFIILSSHTRPMSRQQHSCSEVDCEKFNRHFK